MTDRPVDPVADEVDIRFGAGTYIKEMRAHKAGSALLQHSHSYPHMSVIVRGAVRLYEDGVNVGAYAAPSALLIKAKVEHQFVILADDTIILCIHDAELAEREGVT